MKEIFKQEGEFGEYLIIRFRELDLFKHAFLERKLCFEIMTQKQKKEWCERIDDFKREKGLLTNREKVI